MSKAKHQSLQHHSTRRGRRKVTFIHHHQGSSGAAGGSSQCQCPQQPREVHFNWKCCQVNWHQACLQFAKPKMFRSLGAKHWSAQIPTQHGHRAGCSQVGAKQGKNTSTAKPNAEWELPGSIAQDISSKKEPCLGLWWTLLQVSNLINLTQSLIFC